MDVTIGVLALQVRHTCTRIHPCLRESACLLRRSGVLPFLSNPELEAGCRHSWSVGA